MTQHQGPEENNIDTTLSTNCEEKEYRILNVNWEKEKLPKTLNTSILYSIFKKGNIMSETKNYRVYPF